MLDWRIYDFVWSCTAIDYPLACFSLETKNRCDEGVPLFTIELLVNLKTGKYKAHQGRSDYEHSYFSWDEIDKTVLKDFVKQRQKDFKNLLNSKS